MASTAPNLTLLDLAQGLVEHLQCPSHLEADEVAPDALQRSRQDPAAPSWPASLGQAAADGGVDLQRAPRDVLAGAADHDGAVASRCGAARQIPAGGDAGRDQDLPTPLDDGVGRYQTACVEDWISSANWWTSTTRRVRSGTL